MLPFQERHAKQAEIAKQTDDANNVMYSDWNTKFDAARSKRDIDDAAAAAAYANADYMKRPSVEPNATNSPTVFNELNDFGESISTPVYPETYTAPTYGDNYTQNAPISYASRYTPPNFANLPGASSSPPVPQVPQVQQLTPTAVNTSMPQQPSYIGAGMGTPNTSQTMGRGLSAVGVKAPGT